MGIPKSWRILFNMDDLGVPLVQETSIWVFPKLGPQEPWVSMLKWSHFGLFLGVPPRRPAYKVVPPAAIRCYKLVYKP